MISFYKLPSLKDLGIAFQVYMSEQIPQSSEVCIRIRIHPSRQT